MLTCVRVDPGMALISPDKDQLVIFACFSIAWLMALLQKGAFSFQGVGVRFYGRERIDDGYIATKWLTAGFPLLPIRSYVVAHTIHGASRGEFEYQENAMQPVEGYFHWPQILRTGLISYATISWCLGCLWLMFNSGCR